MAAIQNAALNQPFAEWEEVDVTFSATANADTIIKHTLTPASVEAINYLPIRKGQAADVYHDTSGTRKPWQNGYIILRCTVASAKVRLLLYVGHGSARPSF
jgi:hypothetical protein